MGREIKRVAADFDWPLKETWKGFLNPWYGFCHKCHSCEQTGLNKETKKISDDWYSFDKSDYIYLNDGSGRRYNNAAWSHHLTQDEVDVLAKESRLRDFTHNWSKENGWEEKDPPVIPTAEEVNEWSKNASMGHDSINRWICVETRAKRLGVYGHCDKCNGEGSIWDNPEYKKKAEEWEQEEPPAGDYYQVWETTSEGSPISIPCKTPEELAKWLVDNNASSFGHNTEDYETWLKFIRGPGWAPSAIGVSGKGLQSGVRGVTDET